MAQESGLPRHLIFVGCKGIKVLRNYLKRAGGRGSDKSDPYGTARRAGIFCKAVALIFVVSRMHEICRANTVRYCEKLRDIQFFDTQITHDKAAYSD
jgi:hypothetical protein